MFDVAALAHTPQVFCADVPKIAASQALLILRLNVLDHMTVPPPPIPIADFLWIKLHAKHTQLA